MAICYKDRTFCASPNCKNECGRKITEHEKLEAIINDVPVCYSYICGNNDFFLADEKNYDNNIPTKTIQQSVYNYQQSEKELKNKLAELQLKFDQAIKANPVLNQIITELRTRGIL